MIPVGTPGGPTCLGEADYGQVYQIPLPGSSALGLPPQPCMPPNGMFFQPQAFTTMWAAPYPDYSSQPLPLSTYPPHQYQQGQYIQYPYHQFDDSHESAPLQLEQSSANPPVVRPGPPIQRWKNAKGPAGCNLFVFHIPSDLTNAALHDLFSPHGNVISARIMVDSETGITRGFGFISYDLPGPAQSAISTLNGFHLGRKRLMVQLKQEGPSAPIRGRRQSISYDDTIAGAIIPPPPPFV